MMGRIYAPATVFLAVILPLAVLCAAGGQDDVSPNPVPARVNIGVEAEEPPEPDSPSDKEDPSLAEHREDGAPSGDGCCCPQQGRISNATQRFIAWCKATHWGYHEYFVPEPFGGSLSAHLGMQIANGKAAQLVLYRCDFVDGPGELASCLNGFGRRRLERLAKLLIETPCPLRIEAVPNQPRLNEARHRHVVEQLARILPEPVAPDRVVMCEHDLPGLEAVEAMEIYDNLLEQTRTGSQRRSQGTGGGSYRPLIQVGGGSTSGR
jgi:hypothetical protein